MGRVIHDLHIEHGGQAAEALSADAQLVDLLEQLQTQLFDAVLRTTGFQFMDVDGFHQHFLGHHRSFLGGAADADAEHARRTPAGAHGRNGLQYPVDDGVGWVEHRHLRLVFRTAALGCDVHFHLVTGDDGVVDYRWRVVFGVPAGTCRVGQDRSTQNVLRQVVGTANTLVDHVVQAHACAVPAYVHAHAHEYSDDAGVLADRPVAGRTHPRVDQDLCHGIAGCWRFFAQVGLVHRLDEVDGVVVGDELQSVSNALYQVVLLDHGHAARPLGGAKTVRIEKATDTLSKKCAAV